MAVTRLRIRSDGTAHGTHVETQDGLQIRGVKEVAWRAEAGEGLATATIRVVAYVELDAELEASQVTIIRADVEESKDA